MTDLRRREIGYGLAAKLNKDIKCRVIHKVNTGLLSFSYSHQGCYRCWQTLKLLRESQVSFEMARGPSRSLIFSRWVACDFVVTSGPKGLMGTWLLT